MKHKVELSIAEMRHIVSALKYEREENGGTIKLEEYLKTVIRGREHFEKYMQRLEKKGILQSN